MVQRDTPVEEVAQILELQPTLVQLETPLDEVARTMLAHPRVHVVCVVDSQGRLIGVLDLRTLADDLFFRIMPEEFLSEVTDLDDVLRFAEKSGMRTVADAMKKPVWVKRGEMVKDAFKRMHEHGLPGLPVVDDRHHVVGYINLLELMAVCLDSGDSLDRTEEGP
jgi:CBS domain-containing protein